MINFEKRKRELSMPKKGRSKQKYKSKSKTKNVLQICDVDIDESLLNRVVSNTSSDYQS